MDGFQVVKIVRVMHQIDIFKILEIITGYFKIPTLERMGEESLHHHRAGHGAVTGPPTQRGYTTFVRTMISRVVGASGIHMGTTVFGQLGPGPLQRDPDRERGRLRP